MKILFTLIIILNSYLLYCQEKKIVTYSELAKLMFIEHKDSIVYKNVYFKNDLPNKGGENFFTNYTNDGAEITIYGGFQKYLEENNVNKNEDGFYVSKSKVIYIKECEFENDLLFAKMKFEGAVNIINSIFPNQTEDWVGTYGQIFGGAILIDSCFFNHTFRLLEREEQPYRFFFKFINSTCNDFQLELQKSTSLILGSNFKGIPIIQIHNESSDISIYYSKFEFTQVPYFSFIDLESIRSFSFEGNTIKDTTSNYIQLRLDSKYTGFHTNTFEANTSLTLGESEFELSENIYKKNLTLSFNSIHPSSYIDMQSINHLDFGLRYGSFFDATTDEQIKKEYVYKRYLRLQKILYDYFREIGDIKSANQSYVRIRDIENNRLAFEHKEKPTFKNWFNLKLNRLLKYYTNYSTDPARALVISFYIILLFGLFYFFFPSEWDVKSKGELFKKYREFIEKNDKGYFKPFLKLIGNLVKSYINAVTLSLNAFTTLGFGRIPAHGLARYICIVQGFIGWFLLSLFTVALISQIQL